MTDNHYDFIRERLAPCGLHCGKCFAFAGGPIHELSRELQAALGNFGAYAERFVTLLNDPVYAAYPEFARFLDHLAKGRGGRSGRDERQFCPPHWPASPV